MDLSQFIPQETLTVQKIYDWHKKRGDNETPRTYLGASIIGHECDRYLWYSFRQCVRPEFDGRMYRLFETGHLEEPRFIAELRAIGCEVVDHVDGQQVGISDIGGHFKGHTDGVARGIPEAPKTWHVLEFKTASAKQFAKIKKEGVLKAKPVHFAQMQIYMGKLGLTRALYLVRNKDTDELYSDRVRYDAKAYAAILARAERIIKSIQPSERCATRSDDFRCKFCDAHALCWGSGDVAVPLPAKGCRSCCHATPEMDGEARWSCARGNSMHPCDQHLLIPGLVTFADPVDAGQDWIEFENKREGDNARWRHGSGDEGTWTTEELMATPGPLVGDIAVKATKDAFNGTSTGALPLVDRYPPEDSERLWDGAPEGIDQYPHLTAILSMDRTAEFEDDEHIAHEYNGEFLIVLYKQHNHAAIWKGKE